MRNAASTVRGREAAREQTSRIVFAEIRAASQDRQAKSAALRKQRLEKEAEESKNS